MDRRDVLRLALIGTSCAAGLARALGPSSLRGVPLAHATIGAGGGTLRFDLPPRWLERAHIARRRLDGDAYLASFGICRADLGIARQHITVWSTSLAGALAEIVEAGDRLFVMWDGVAYRLEAA